MTERGSYIFWGKKTHVNVKYRFDKVKEEFRIFARRDLTADQLDTMIDIMSEETGLPKYLYQWRYNSLGINPATKLGYKVYNGFTIHYLDVDRT